MLLSGSASPAPALTSRAALPKRPARQAEQRLAPRARPSVGWGAAVQWLKRRHTLHSPHVGLTLGVPFGPLEWEVSEIHDLRQ